MTERITVTEREPRPGQQWKCGDEFLPFHPQASHVPPDYRDGWNRCYWMAAPVVPPGYHLVIVPDLQPADEPDWDECIRQAEVATGLKVERHTLSIVIREVRRWLAGRPAGVKGPEPTGRKRLCRDCADLAEDGICPNDGKPCSTSGVPGTLNKQEN